MWDGALPQSIWLQQRQKNQAGLYWVGVLRTDQAKLLSLQKASPRFICFGVLSRTVLLIVKDDLLTVSQPSLICVIRPMEKNIPDNMQRLLTLRHRSEVPVWPGI